MLLRSLRVIIMLALAGLVFKAELAPAQQLPGLSSDIQDRLSQTLRGTSSSDPSQSLQSPLDGSNSLGGFGNDSSSNSSYQQYLLQQNRRRPTPLSKLEVDYARRVGGTVRQFGYDLFQNYQVARRDNLAGAVSDSYRLNVGDEVVVTLRGQNNRSYRVRVDREGRILLPELPPVTAAGRSYGEFRADLENIASSTLLNTELFVSLGAVRQVQVLVVGEVAQPGSFRLGGFSTVLDALVSAGGVKLTGSLRRVIVNRGSTSISVDLYQLFALGGAAGDPTLLDGDRIVVPPLGPTVAIAGEVVRPGIYELPSGGRIDGATLLALGGGPLRPAGNRLVHLTVDAGGRDVTTELPSVSRVSFASGDVLLLLRGQDIQTGAVYLDGHVRVPSVRSIGTAPMVSRLVGSFDQLNENPYLLFAAVQTTDDRTQARRFVPINLARILNGQEDFPLKSNDLLVILGRDDVRYLQSADVQAVLSGRLPPSLLPANQLGVAQKSLLDSKGDLASVTGDAPGGAAAAAGGAGAANISRQLEARQAAQSSANLQFQQALQQQQLQQYGGNPQQGFNGQNGQFQGQGGYNNFGSNDRNGQDRQPQPPKRRPGDLRGLNQPVEEAELERRQQQQVGVCKGLQELAAISSTARAGRFANAIQSAVASGNVEDTLQNIQPCPPIYDKYPELLPLAIEFAVSMNGELRTPGVYPIANNTTLAAVVSAAGDVTREADLRNIEITRFAVDNGSGQTNTTRQLVSLTRQQFESVSVNPGDVLRFNPIFNDRDDGPVVLSGEFRRPGLYGIRRGERLSQLIERAGGLTDQAYPYGAVFTRERVKRSEKENFERQARELQSGLALALSRSSTGTQAAAGAGILQQLIVTLRDTQPVGRVVIEADPTVLQVRPEIDVVLEAGDRIVMPKRPSSVAISGEVLNAGSMQFVPGGKADDYIRMAGSYTQAADQGRIFVIYPNGQAEPVKVSFWNYTPIQIPPGSTVVVPRDPVPFDAFGLVTQVGTIFSQLAIAGASLAVINR